MPARSASCSSRTCPGGGRGVARTVGEEQPVGADRLHVLDGRGRREHVHLDAALAHHPRGVGLDAEVHGGDLEPRSLRRRPGAVSKGAPCGDDVGLLRADGLAEVGAGHLARLQHPRQQALGVGLRRGDADAHRTALAQVAGQRTGVDAADADDALVAQVVVQAAHAAPAGRDAGRVAHDVAGDPDAGGLGVLVVHAGVADVRGRHHDDLAVVAGVGQRLLVAGHAGGEDRLAEGLALGSERLTAKGAPVLEDQDRWGRQSHAVPPSPPHGTDR